MASKMISNTNTSLLPVLVLILGVLMFLKGTTAQTGCTKTLMALSPCLNYVTGNSSTPTSSCCSQLSNVVSSQPQCLCLLLNGTTSSYGLNINQTLALQLPNVCSVQTPPTSKCTAAENAPAPSSASPADSSQQPQAIPSGSKTVPSQNGATNAKAPYNIAAFLLFLAISSYALSVAGI